jgi:hypothetical protein
MCDGVTISADLGGERLTIKAIGPLERTYQLGELSTTVDLVPRRERWYGSLGIYRAEGDGQRHLVLDEGFQYFDSQEEFQEWIAWQQDRMKYVHTSDGLVLGWALQRNDSEGLDEALSVELWQVLIKGKKPAILPNSDDAAFTVEKAGTACPEPSTGYSASQPRTIGQRTYSGRALDFMRERGIDPGIVEKAIKNGTHDDAGERVNVTYYDPDDTTATGVSWVRLDRSGNVLLIG